MSLANEILRSIGLTADDVRRLAKRYGTKVAEPEVIDHRKKRNNHGEQKTIH